MFPLRLSRRELLTLSGACLLPSEEPPSRRTLAYPPSRLFSGVKWLSEPSKYPGSGTDMHWWTWAADDALYLVDDDGVKDCYSFPPPDFGNLPLAERRIGELITKHFIRDGVTLQAGIGQ